ncbi:MAG: hypothetical protein GQ574_20050 [Crocinitomix sp.]|nr:hypothetical protein [Crocinitomix sp.]
MDYDYDVAEKQLSINLELPKNRGGVNYEGTTIGEFCSHKELGDGKIFSLSNGDNIFLKFINKAEGFTVMLNNRHVIQSAGHPIKLLKRTLMPLKIGLLIFALQLLYVLFDLWRKGEFSTLNFSVKTIVYIAYFALIILLLFIGIQLSKKGKWKGVVLGFAILLFNLVFSLGLGLYYNTGFNLFVWSFLTAHAFVLILLFTHSAIVSYVRSYARSLKA